MPYPVVYMPRTIGGEFRPSNFLVPQSSDPQRFVNVNFPVPRGMRGEIRDATWSVPPFFSGDPVDPKPPMFDWDSIKKFVTDNATFIGLGIGALLLMQGGGLGGGRKRNPRRRRNPGVRRHRR